MEKRNRGEKLPNNFVKTAILLYLTDSEKSASEIRDYLKVIHNIKEPKGVRVHLAKLYDEGYLDKKVKKGIGSYYTWKESVESFQKIISFLSTHSQLIRQVEIQNLKYRDYNSVKVKLKSKWQRKLKTEELEMPYPFKYGRGHEMRYLSKLSDLTQPFDTSRFWYNTEYTRKFLNKKTLRYCIHIAYQKCKNDEKVLEKYKEYGAKLRKYRFRHNCFYQYNDDSLVAMMFHSYTLVSHMVNLEQNYRQYMIGSNAGDEFIFRMVMTDLFYREYPALEMEYFKKVEFIERRLKNGKFDGLDMHFSCSLGDIAEEIMKEKHPEGLML
ncbi:MAG: winged helix-turn-helix domain-containing protein [Nitrosopumilus sp.]|uniref:winged helix-turn-helix domain-containing protein n=1 Tax=Nitrosopumilus sp. TaxID=2024843 RepID=UPI00246D9B8D|nr:winged helix-turn-helix domain-containing protein [Nitrosopumilus sp.]MDH5431652.1 winged helix-turn-helix domain-containing protein [Nitrosopumilus sp.]